MMSYVQYTQIFWEITINVLQKILCNDIMYMENIQDNDRRFYVYEKESKNFIA
jgi:hypothetical protein